MKGGMNLKSKIMRTEVDCVMSKECELSFGEVHMWNKKGGNKRGEATMVRMIFPNDIVELYVLYVKVWFYEHTTRFGKQDKKRYPRLASWDRVDHGGRYDANLLLKDIREDEVIRRICR